MEFPKVVAIQGTNRYLIQVSEDEAHVIDWQMRRVFPKMNMQSILARGYWEEFTGPESIIPMLLDFFKNNKKAA